MHNPDANVSPFNALPGVLIALGVFILGIELFFQLAESGLLSNPTAIGWRLNAARTFGYSDQIFEWMRTNGQYPAEHVMRILTYSFVQVSFISTVFVVVFVVALGKAVSVAMSQSALLVIFFGSAIFGALGYSLIVNESYLMFGGFPASYGMIGAFTWIQLVVRINTGQPVWPAFQLILFLIAIQFIYKFAFKIETNEWIAEICGFVAGFILSIGLERNGRALISVLFAKLRKR